MEQQPEERAGVIDQEPGITPTYPGQVVCSTELVVDRNEPANRNNNIGFPRVREVKRRKAKTSVFEPEVSPVKAGERALSSHPGRAPDAGIVRASNSNRVLVVQ